MKKLMITLTAAMSTAMVMSATPTAQVYDVSFKVYTTEAATASVNNKQNPLAVGVGEGSRSVTYRKRSTLTWKGFIWGCGCESINGRWEKVNKDSEYDNTEQLDTIKGCILWDVKTKMPVYIGNGSDITDAGSVPGTDFGWQILHAMNKDGKQVEGTFTMKQSGNACDENGILFEFVGSGFGSAYLDVECCEPTCLSYIKTMTGYFAGYMRAPTKFNVNQPSGCTYCGISGGEVTCDFAEAWQWCDWNNGCACGIEIEDDLDLTSAYGTWTVKYNSALSKKMAKPAKITTKGVSGVVVSIRDVYDFKNLPYVASAIEAVENKIWGIKTPCEKLADEIAEATDAVEEAQKNADAVTTEQLLEDIELAKDNAYITSSNLFAKTSASTKAENALKMATYDYNKMSNTLATAYWKIDYVNSSGKPTYTDGKGLESFDEKIDDLEHYTVIKYEFNKEKVTPNTYAGAKKFVTGKETTLSNLKKTLDDKTDAYEFAKSEKEVAEFMQELCSENLKTAQVRYADRVNLQYKANQALLAAQNTLNDLEEEYEELGCK